MKKLFLLLAGFLLLVVLLIVGGFLFSSSEPLPPGCTATHIVVYKNKRQLKLFAHDTLLKTYHIALGDQPTGHKQREGDERTPEGKYTIDWRNRKSICHLSLHVSYPNRKDKEFAGQRGWSPGGNIMIHGLLPRFRWLGSLHSLRDWTDGCMAVTNEEIEEIWRAVPNGTPIEIKP